VMLAEKMDTGVTRVNTRRAVKEPYLDSGVHHRVAPRAYRGEFRRAILPRATTAAH